MSVNDAEPVPAVVLLARPGAARERLREALAHAGVMLVLEDDPVTVDAATLRAVAPCTVVIALEPAVDDALERLDEVLASPAFLLVFDEADVAARRDGWEVQRWGRHLAAKLHGHRQVLPPGAEGEDDVLLEPGRPVNPVRPGDDHPLSFHVEEATDVAGQVPADGLYAPPDHLQEPQSLEEALAASMPLAPVAHEAEAPAAEAPAPPATGFGDHSAWSLVDEDAAPSPSPVQASAPASVLPPAFDTDRLQLVDLEPAAPAAQGARGAVVVLAGIGGPDALRRLLAGLPPQLDIPLLVRMPLEGARYGNLVKQMARVSPLPVALAEPGAQVENAAVYILADDTGVVFNEGGLAFASHAQGIDLLALPPAESAVVVLSGADLMQVDPALRLAEAGAWVGGQVGDGCYDPAAATAVVAAGMFAGEPQELAQAIAARWAVADEGDAR
ncbi:chemotaxis protein CheB [Xanthomonas sp. 60]